MSKYKLYIFIAIITLLCFFNYVSAENKTLPLISKVIYIDPGHGGVDSGAYYKGIKESTLNLEISKQVSEALKKDGATVYLTRYDDYDLATNNAAYRKRSDLSKRANIINKSGCDMFISIHLNADSDKSWYGAQIYYDSINPENKKIAAIFEEELQRYLNTNRKFKEDNTKYMQRRINRPGILLEAGFLSNESERYLLQKKTYQQKIAEVVRKSVVKYYAS
ncbi:MAG: N-acetylmuramoyl-L-alanine amidase [Bacilli bacterium]|nr:N-acetylmuramoyl-L-alanine amidase [Bacilli bacterium]